MIPMAAIVVDIKYINLASPILFALTFKTLLIYHKPIVKAIK